MCTIYNAKNIVINQIVIGHAEKIVFECEQLKEFNDYFKAMDLNDIEQEKENDYFTKDLNEQENEFDVYFANTIDFNSIYVL